MTLRKPSGDRSNAPASQTAGTGAGTITAPADSGRFHDCGLCGHRFPASDMSCHQGCPLSRHCSIVCCPACGYEFVDTGPIERRIARLTGLLRRVTGRTR